MSEQEVKDAKLLAEARFKERDVVVTNRSVRPINPRGKKEGYGDAGWKWRIVRRYVDWIGKYGKGRAVYYEVVAHDAPGMYSATLREFQIKHAMGKHDGNELHGPKTKTILTASVAAAATDRC